MDLLKPEQIFAGRYRILRKLAGGGMGAVYVALQEATELQVALKVLWPHVLQRSDAVERFAIEAKISARIGSEHIVQVFDAGFDQETQMPFLVMELLQGATLQSLVEQRGPLPAAEAVELIKQIARGLDRAHAYKDANGNLAPVVHRDLKPENLFVVRRESGEPWVKILDYGIAKILSQSTASSRDMRGTPLFMAYEQAEGGELSPQTDLWPLGLIAYFILTGENYWHSSRAEHSSLNRLMTEIVVLPMPPPSQRIAESAGRALPHAFDAWFQRCVNRDPEARFSSAGEAARELAVVLATPFQVQDSFSPELTATLISEDQLATSTTVSNAPANMTMNPSSISSLRPPQPRSWRWVAGGAGVSMMGVVAFLIWRASYGSKMPEEVMGGAEPSARLTEELPPALPTIPEIIQGFVRIEPAIAIVKVNGEERALVNGELQLKGVRGATFEVEVAVGDDRQFTSVQLLEEGTVVPAEIILQPPAPHSGSQSKPKASAASVAATSTRKKPVSAAEALSQTTVPSPSKTPQTPQFQKALDPLEGPRVH